MRATSVLPTCQDQRARSAITYALTNARWAEAAEKKEPPPDWNILKHHTRREITRCVRRCLQLKLKHPKWHRPLLIEKFLPGHDPAELERQLKTWIEPQLIKWKEEAYYGAALGRGYFFGLIRLDETYNETEAARAFRAWFRKRYGKTKRGGGGWREWQAKLNDLVAIRLRKRFPGKKNLIKRVQHVAELTTAGFARYKAFWNDRQEARREKREVEQRMSKAANVEMSSAKAGARKFFRQFFPDEEPMSL
jgi:hypothetical protein